MMTPSNQKFVCIHGHFYQPPRENPWLEELETEDSASPYHDWNERIHAECYRANAAARLVDEKNRIISLRNNYRLLSYNFGPTLFRWIEKHDPWLYQVIIDSDRDSCQNLDGHGNAMAQVYNHLIMPLANRRDKITQVLWGIGDFKRRFGRHPEGMWLAETAVDRESLQIMAEAGIKFTVLSPFQARRWRFIDGGDGWLDATNGKIPTGRAYCYDCGNGKTIHLFFYDGDLAKGVAFEHLLDHSSRLVARINWAHKHQSAAKDEPWLIHAATDGESYGHHFKFGDMALAAAFRELERDPQARIMNYGAFLASFPVLAEVEILDNSSWSCAHGIGRWERDCGCHIGGESGWNQKWRAPLREAMNFLRDTLAAYYEREMGKFSDDPWKVRNDYVDVLNNIISRKQFFEGHRRPGSNAEQTPDRFFQLLEMQRASMSMFTSCGWFFDDISNLEAIIILRFAARAIQLAEQTGADSTSLESSFLKILEKAQSNLPKNGNGATVYIEKAKSEIVPKDRVAANYAFQTLARSSLDRYHIYCYDIIPEHEDDLGPNPVPCLYGQIKVRDTRTAEEDSYLYAVLHFGGLDFRCSVKPFISPEEYQTILDTLQRCMESQNTVQVIRTLDAAFGTVCFGLHDVFRDQRASIALEIAQEKLSLYTAFQRHFYQINQPLILSLRQWGIRVPSDLRVAVRRVLSDEIYQLVDEILEHEQEHSAEEPSWSETDYYFRTHLGRLHTQLQDAKSWGVSLQLTRISRKLGNAIIENLGDLTKSLSPANAGQLSRVMEICQALGIKAELWKAQTLYFEFAHSLANSPQMISKFANIEDFLTKLDTFLGCRFARLVLESAGQT